LWDYLRRSGASGYFLPLSGGADSASTAAIVGNMCQLVIKAAKEGDEDVERDIRRVAQLSADAPVPNSPRELAGIIFTTVYLGTDNSSAETRARAKDLANDIGASHLSVAIDIVVSAVVSFFVAVTGKTPKFKVDGGSNAENLALQNIQARVRMVLSFLFAQLLPWVRGKSGFLLVLGSANVDEGLRGYMTKYDCSSADVNPIGGISKADLRSFLRWGASNLGYPTLAEVEKAPPTAELEPIRENYVQTDEEDMGMTYEELGVYGRLRKIARLGPLAMVQRLHYAEWANKGLSAKEIGEKVKKFFFYYSCNRHKMTTLTPSYHAENYSPDDNRFDQRQFLYNVRWPWQFRKIDEFVDRVTKED
jgi:NAD+ synthase (glutamine-hydrolysing)